MLAVMFAHQGGWDEALLVLAPIMFIFVVLYFAKRKAEAIGNSESRSANEPGGPANVAGGIAGVSDSGARRAD